MEQERKIKIIAEFFGAILTGVICGYAWYKGYDWLVIGYLAVRIRMIWDKV